MIARHLSRTPDRRHRGFTPGQGFGYGTRTPHFCHNYVSLRIDHRLRLLVRRAKSTPGPFLPAFVLGTNSSERRTQIELRKYLIHPMDFLVFKCFS